MRSIGPPGLRRRWQYSRWGRLLLARGVSLPVNASLIRAGLAADQVPMRRGRGPRLVARVRITDAGRQALAEQLFSAARTNTFGKKVPARAAEVVPIKGCPRHGDKMT